MSVRPSLKLGLIGDNIKASRSPQLHRLAGEQLGMEVTYDRLVPIERGEDFQTLFRHAEGEGYRGLNITYPYKEQVLDLIRADTTLIGNIGAVNTVLFDRGQARGFNTDHSGFAAAYANVRGDTPPGVTLMIGTGGVGRAIAFSLAVLGASALRLVDRDATKAARLAADLQSSFPELPIQLGSSAEELAHGVQGIVNCTPVGMVGHQGTMIKADALAGAEWAFDAVYTPKETQFLRDATTHGVQTISGWELFFYQGLHAWALFSEQDADPVALRAALSENAN